MCVPCDWRQGDDSICCGHTSEYGRTQGLKHVWRDPIARKYVEEPLLQQRPDGAREVGPAVGRLNGTELLMLSGLQEDRRHVGEMVDLEKPLIGRHERRQLLMFCGRRECIRTNISGLKAGHPQLTDRSPKGFTHRWLFRHRPEIAALFG